MLPTTLKKLRFVDELGDAAILAWIFSAKRAIRAAANNVNSLCNCAQLDELKRRGYKYKEWRTIMDGRERATHAAANGQRVPIDEPFWVGGFRMMFPRDTTYGAPAREIMNCRCCLSAPGVGNISGKARKNLTSERESGTIKSIDVDDFKIMVKGHNINEEVSDTIVNTIREYEKKGGLCISQANFGEFYDEETYKPALFQIILNKHDLVEINVNSKILSGLTLEEANALIANAHSNLPKSIREAIIHECGHAKAYYRKNYWEILQMNNELKSKGIKGISAIAEKDGAECIAEVEVLLSRGANVPKEAMQLYNKYIGGRNK